MNRWGDGKYCEDGNKVYCCEVPNAEENKCYWTGVGGTCKSGDETLVSGNKEHSTRYAWIRTS